MIACWSKKCGSTPLSYNILHFSTNLVASYLHLTPFKAFTSMFATPLSYITTCTISIPLPLIQVQFKRTGTSHTLCSHAKTTEHMITPTRVYTPCSDFKLHATIRARKDAAAPLLRHLPRSQILVESQAHEFYELSQPRRHGRIAM